MKRFLAGLFALLLLSWGASARAEVDRYVIDLDVGDGFTMRGTVTAPLAHHGGHPRIAERLIVMLPGPTANADWFLIDADGYDAPAFLAEEDGDTVVALDPLGVGQSDGPADGSITDTDWQLPYMRNALWQLRLRFLAAKVGVYGEGGLGGELAIKLAGDPLAPLFVNWVSASAMLYRESTDFTRAAAMSPEAQAGLDFIKQVFGGYLPTEAANYDGFLANAGASQDVIDFTHATQPGLYATGPMRSLAFADLPDHPLYDPRPAHVDALVFWGTADIVAMPGDVEEMTADYGSCGGGRARYVAINGGGHLMRLGPSANGPDSPFWSEFRQFARHH